MRARSAQLAEALPVRGAGLLLGARDEGPAGEIVADCFDAGLLVTSAGPDHAAAYAAADRHPRRGRAGDLDPPGGPSLTAHRRERQGAILRLIRERQISTQAELAAALHDAGLRGRPDHRLARHRRARARQGPRRRAAGSSTRSRAPPTSTGCGELEGALRRWALAIEANDSLVVVFTPRGFSAALAEAIDESSHPHVLATVAGDNTDPRRAGDRCQRPRALREELSRHLLEGAA